MSQSPSSPAPNSIPSELYRACDVGFLSNGTPKIFTGSKSLYAEKKKNNEQVPPVPQLQHPLSQGYDRTKKDIFLCEKTKTYPNVEIYTESQANYQGISLFDDASNIVSALNCWLDTSSFAQISDLIARGYKLDNKTVRIIAKLDTKFIATATCTWEDTDGYALTVRKTGPAGHYGVFPSKQPIPDEAVLESLFQLIKWKPYMLLTTLRGNADNLKPDYGNGPDDDSSSSAALVDHFIAEGLSHSDHLIICALVAFGTQNHETLLQNGWLPKLKTPPISNARSHALFLAEAILCEAKSENRCQFIDWLIPHLPLPSIEVIFHSCNYLYMWANVHDPLQDVIDDVKLGIILQHLQQLIKEGENHVPFDKNSIKSDTESNLANSSSLKTSLDEFNKAVQTFQLQDTSDRFTDAKPLLEIKATFEALHACLQNHTKVDRRSDTWLRPIFPVVKKLLDYLHQHIDLYEYIQIITSMRRQDGTRINSHMHQQFSPPAFDLTYDKNPPLTIIRSLLSLLPFSIVLGFPSFLDEMPSFFRAVISPAPEQNERDHWRPLVLRAYVSTLPELHVRFPSPDLSVISDIKYEKGYILTNGVFDIDSLRPVSAEPSVLRFTHLAHAYHTVGDFVQLLTKKPGKVTITGSKHSVYAGPKLFWLTPVVSEVPGEVPESGYGSIRIKFPIRHFLEEPFGDMWYKLGSRLIPHLASDGTSVVEVSHSIMLTRHQSFGLGEHLGCSSLYPPGSFSNSGQEMSLPRMDPCGRDSNFISWTVGADTAKWTSHRTMPQFFDQVKFALHLPHAMVFDSEDDIKIEFVDHQRFCFSSDGSCNQKFTRAETINRFVKECVRQGVDLFPLQSCFEQQDWSEILKLLNNLNAPRALSSSSKESASLTAETEQVPFVFVPDLTAYRKSKQNKPQMQAKSVPTQCNIISDEALPQTPKRLDKCSLDSSSSSSYSTSERAQTLFSRAEHVQSTLPNSPYLSPLPSRGHNQAALDLGDLTRNFLEGFGPLNSNHHLRTPCTNAY